MSALTRIPRPRQRVVRLDVDYQDDGPRQLVGRLGEDARGTIYFEYDAAITANSYHGPRGSQLGFTRIQRDRGTAPSFERSSPQVLGVAVSVLIRP